MRQAVRAWVHSHRRILVLKGAVGAALTINHYFPSDAGVFINLIWLFVF